MTWYASTMPTRLPMHDGEPFIATLEKAIKNGNADFIEANMPALERLIAAMQARQYELAQIHYRARTIREQHEPPADKRLRRRQ